VICFAGQQNVLQLDRNGYSVLSELGTSIYASPFYCSEATGELVFNSNNGTYQYAYNGTNVTVVQFDPSLLAPQNVNYNGYVYSFNRPSGQLVRFDNGSTGWSAIPGQLVDSYSTYASPVVIGAAGYFCCFLILTELFLASS